LKRDKGGFAADPPFDERSSLAEAIGDGTTVAIPSCPLWPRCDRCDEPLSLDVHASIEAPMAPGGGSRRGPAVAMVDGPAAGDERLMNDDLATCSDAPD